MHRQNLVKPNLNIGTDPETLGFQFLQLGRQRRVQDAVIQFEFVGSDEFPFDKCQVLVRSTIGQLLSLVSYHRVRTRGDLSAVSGRFLGGGCQFLNRGVICQRDGFQFLQRHAATQGRLLIHSRRLNRFQRYRIKLLFGIDEFY